MPLPLPLRQSTALVANLFSFKANVTAAAAVTRLLYFRSVDWRVPEHKNYCFRLTSQTAAADGIRGETVTAGRAEVYDWLATGAPPASAKSGLECSATRSRLGLEAGVSTGGAFRELRGAIIGRGETLGVSEEHIQEWLSTGRLPGDMRRSLGAELVCSAETFDAIFRELRAHTQLK